MSDEVKQDQLEKEQESDSEVTTNQEAPAADAASSGQDSNEDASAEPEVYSPEQERMKNLVVTVLRTVFDPEIPVNIYELGLIYKVEVSEENDIKVTFTLTSPNCPAAQDLPMEMERKIKALEGVGKVEMVLTWEPTWTPEMMTEAAKLQLNMF